MLEICIALVEHLRIHVLKKRGKKSNSQCVSVIYTSVVLLKAIVSTEMALKLWKVMSSGKGKISRCTQGSVHTTKLQSKPYQENSHEKKIVHKEKNCKFSFTTTLCHWDCLNWVFWRRSNLLWPVITGIWWCGTHVFLVQWVDWQRMWRCPWCWFVWLNRWWFWMDSSSCSKPAIFLFNCLLTCIYK